MIITPFDAADELIIVPATIWSPRGAYRELLMAVDTGSTETLVMPHITDELGYGAHLGEQITVIRSVVGREQGYLMPVARFSALGFDMPDFRMHVHDLPDGYGIEDILGLSFLRRFDYDVRSLRGELRVVPASLEGEPIVAAESKMLSAGARSSRGRHRTTSDGRITQLQTPCARLHHVL